MYEKTLLAGWADMDFNAHMRNTAYLDKAVDVRMLFLSDHGFPMQEFVRLRLGPVVMSDNASYFREVGLLTQLRVTLEIAGHSDDGSRWVMRNEFHMPDGKLAARLDSAGGWMDLAARRLAAPPPKLRDAMHSLTRTGDFRVLPSSLKDARA